jgi:phosphoenolpyruvate carboxylase
VGVQLLTDVIATPPPEPATLQQWLPQLTPNTLQSVQVLQAVANVKGMVGDKAIGAYCISMAQSADDVFEVLFLGWIINRGLVLKTDDGWQVRAECLFGPAHRFVSRVLWGAVDRGSRARL